MKLFSTLTLAVSAIISQAYSVPIFIENADFEAPYVVNGTWTNNYIPGWQGTGPGGAAFGVYNPPDGDFTSIPSGINVAYVERGSIFQVLNEKVSANTDYSLLVYVGGGLTVDQMEGYSICLEADGTVLSQTSGGALQPGQFAPMMLSYSASAADVNIGKNLVIRFSEIGTINEGSETNFDKVSLDASPSSSVPEPGIVTLFIMSFAGLMSVMGMRKKSNRRRETI